MNKNVVITTLFLLNIPSAFAEMKGEISIGFGDDHIDGLGNTYHSDIRYDGNTVPIGLKLQWDDLELEALAVSGADNFLGGKPLSILMTADYTFYRFESDNVNSSLSTGISFDVADTSDNYVGGNVTPAEGALWSVGINYKGYLEGIPNTYLKAGAGYTYSLTNDADSSPFAMVGFGLEIPHGKFRFQVSADLVLTNILVGTHTKIQLGSYYLWKENWIITGPGKTLIIPLGGGEEITDSTDVVGLKYLTPADSWW